jgi:hypothetical protein
MLCTSLSPVICIRANVLFTLFVFACALWCPMHSVLCFYFVCRRLMYPMLPVSLCNPTTIRPYDYDYAVGKRSLCIGQMYMESKFGCHK